MGYWEKVKSMNKLMEFSEDWKTLKDVKEEYNLTETESWKLFRRVILKYEEFECRDENRTGAGCPNYFRTKPNALYIMRLEQKQK